jgi:hypothetical protein
MSNLSKVQFMGMKELGEHYSSDYNIGAVKHIDRRYLDAKGANNHIDYDALKEDISRNGIKTPIEVSHSDEEGSVLEDGHHRYVIAKELGLKKVPVRRK